MIITIVAGTWRDKTGMHCNQPILFISNDNAWATVPDIPVVTNEKGNWYRANTKLMNLLTLQFHNRFHVEEKAGHTTLKFTKRGSVKL